MSASSGFQRGAAWLAVAVGVLVVGLGILLWLKGPRRLGIVLVCFGLLDTAFWLRRALAAPRNAV